MFKADVFENFRNICFETHKLDHARFLTAPGLTLKKIKAKLDLLLAINMLLMIEKVVIGAICHAICRYAKTNNKHMKDYDKNKESSYLK